MANKKFCLKDVEIKHLGLKKGNKKNSYRLNEEQQEQLMAFRQDSTTTPNNYKNQKEFVLSAWNDAGFMMDIDVYCKHYNLPRDCVKSYKLITHSGTPFYNIVFDTIVEGGIDFDFKEIIGKHFKPFKQPTPKTVSNKDFDVLTITDVHIGMDTDKFKNSMYPTLWNRETILKSVEDIIETTIEERESNILYIDELGDFLDGFNSQTTRKGHDLPQNMTNEEAFDCAIEFKQKLLDGLCGYYDKIILNNICNDNHAGAFGYFVNKAILELSKLRYNNVEVNNHRKFINHYYVGKIAFLITHGKDDSTLRYGFKPKLDSQGLEKIDQYCKNNDIYKNSDLIIMKKGDSHQALFDMCTSDDFFYFNYPALSPSSQWVQNNFKRGRRGFVNESYKGLKCYVKPFFK